MKIKDLIKKPGFWTAVVALIVLLLNLVGLKAEKEVVNQLIMGICSLLIILGFMTTKEKKDIENELKDDDENK